jgi:hypothetical protein
MNRQASTTTSAPWTPEAEQYLRDHCHTQSLDQLAAALGRTRVAIKSRCCVLGLNRSGRKRFSIEEINFLRQYYTQRGAAWCAGLLQRDVKSVYHVTFRCGIARKMDCVPTEQLESIIREKHPLGWSDSEIVDYVGLHFSRTDRHRVGQIRKRLGLPSNRTSQHFRQKVAAKTREQCAAAGVKSLGAVRRQAYDQWKRKLGWPEHLTVRAVQAMELFWRHGSLTRIQLCSLMGVSAEARTEPKSNAPSGTVLGELVAAGLIGRLQKAVKLSSDVRVHNDHHPTRPNKAQRKNRWKYIDLYFIQPGVKPNGRDTEQRTEAGGAGSAASEHSQRHTELASADASRGGELDRRDRCAGDREKASRPRKGR